MEEVKKKTMWIMTEDGDMVNLSLSARVYSRKALKGDGVEVVATIPGWKEILKGKWEYEELASGYVPVILFKCRYFMEAAKLIEKISAALHQHGEEVIEIENPYSYYEYGDDEENENG